MKLVEGEEEFNWNFSTSRNSLKFLSDSSQSVYTFLSKWHTEKISNKFLVKSDEMRSSKQWVSLRGDGKTNKQTSMTWSIFLVHLFFLCPPFFQLVSLPACEKYMCNGERHKNKRDNGNNNNIVWKIVVQTLLPLLPPSSVYHCSTIYFMRATHISVIIFVRTRSLSHN